MVTLYDFLRIIAIFYGTLWMTFAFYTHYPVISTFLEKEFNNQTVYVEGKNSVPDGEYPTIDVLLPAYKESNVLRYSIRSIRESHYPQDKLSVIVLTEVDDEQTREKLAELKEMVDFDEVDCLGGYFTELVVPEDYPGEGSKPRALNFGFQETYGDIVGVIDAEDVIEPDLFLKVAGAIEGEGYDYVQGALDMKNEDDGWLNTMFRGEYGWWYQLLIPGMYQAGYPVPLGGTTNFYSREVLDEISDIRENRFGTRWEPEEDLWLSNVPDTGPIPWDPRNVTEDFELGLLLWLEGYQLGLIDSITREESPLTLRAWLRQRTRWQKGKIQTFLQYTRNPPKDGTARTHIWLQSVVPHLGPINLSGLIIIFGISYLIIGIEYQPIISGILIMGVGFVLFSMILQSYGYLKASDAPHPLRAVRALINGTTLLAYWILVWVADIRALYQVYNKKTEWEKTKHHGRHIPQPNSASSPASGEHSE